MPARITMMLLEGKKFLKEKSANQMSQMTFEQSWMLIREKEEEARREKDPSGLEQLIH